MTVASKNGLKRLDERIHKKLYCASTTKTGVLVMISKHKNAFTLSAMAVAIAASLSACGGAATKSDATSAGGVVVAPPVEAKCANPKASNAGSVGKCVFSYTGVADNALIVTGAAQAQGEGYTGSKAKVAIFGGQHNSKTAIPFDGFATGDAYAPMDKKLSYYIDFTGSISNGNGPDTNAGDSGRTSQLASLIVGKETEHFKGGIAQDAWLYWGRSCFNGTCYDTATKWAVQAYLNWNVKIFNITLQNELGNKYPSGNVWDMAEAIYQANALAVVAAGDKGQDNPSHPGNIVAFIPKYESNWLTVANAVVDASGNVVGLDAQSNKCGAAKNYCLVAPGYQQVEQSVESGLTGSTFINGTDSASAVVSGVAAQVKGAYSWMTGENLHDVLLGTAIDIGEKGVDSVYGWGLVNAAKAVHGPENLFTTFDANVTKGAVSTFSNDMYSTGGLLKSGEGTLVLTGNNTYTGGTKVSGGVLEMRGSLASDVEVTNGMFVSYGQTINANYTAKEGGTTGVVLGQPVTVNGTANLAGTVHFVNPGAAYSVKSNEVVMKASEIKGTFDKVSYANDFFWNAQLKYNQDSVTASMSRTSASTASVAMNVDQSVVDGAKQADAVVNVLDKAFANGASDSVFSESLSRIMMANNGDVETSLASVTGAVMGANRSAQVSAALGQQNMLSDHLSALDMSERNVWAKADALDGSVERMGYTSAKWETSGMSGGVDIPLDHGLAVGVMGRSGTSRVDMGSDRLRGDDIGVSVWAHQNVGDGYISAMLGATHSEVKTTRSIVSGSVVESAVENRTDWTGQARLEVGVNMTETLAPYVAMGAVSHKQGGFTETVESGLGLTAKADRATAVFGEVGVRLNGEVGDWYYNATAAYSNVFSGRNLNYTAAFEGMDTVGFDVASPRVASDRFRATFGGGYNVSERVKVFASFTAESASGDHRANVGGQLGASIAF